MPSQTQTAATAPAGAARQPWLLAMVATSIVILVAWGLAVPPFEGTDESAFYQDLMGHARGAPGGRLPLYDVLLRPVISLAGRQVQRFEARYNPSFRFVSNERGRVNVFMHGRTQGMLQGDVNRLYLLRLVTSLMWIVGLVLTFETARLWFGRSDLAMLVAMLCVSIPQFSFFGSNIHAESTATLLGTIAYLALALRVQGRIGRTLAWLVGLGVVGLAPFSDRQAYFVVLLVPFGLVLSESTWRARFAAIGALTAPAVLLGLLPQFAYLRYEIGYTVLGSFSSSYHGKLWAPDNYLYLAYEFAPKLFFSFCGWLGQPSILLPAALYAAMGVLMLLGIAGLFTRTGGAPLTDTERRLAWILGFGVFVTVAPIVYANILISRNSWYGRWLFPSLGPMMIGLVAGWRRSIALAGRRPHLVSAVLTGVAVCLALVWIGPPGAAIRAGVRANHYGDQQRVIDTFRDLIALFAVAAVAVEVGALAARRFAWRVSVAHVAAGACTFNLVLLLAFVWPLYRPFDDRELASAIGREVAQGEYERASALYRIAVGAYPGSAALRSVVDDNPMVLLAGADEQSIGELGARIGQGRRLTSRVELMTLARLVRLRPTLVDGEIVRRVVEQSGGLPELAEPAALLRVQLAGGTRDPDVGAEIVRAGGGVVLNKDVRGEALFVGFTVHPGAPGFNDLTLYFRPGRPWTSRRFWMNAYPNGLPEYVRVDPMPPAFEAWEVGELGWERFEIPANTRYSVYLGLLVEGFYGEGVPLGWIGQ